MDSSNVADNSQPNKGTKNNGVPIRTVCAVERSRNKIDKMRMHFGQFGKIESVAERFERFAHHNWHYLVQFEREEDAKQALLHKNENWHNIEVTAADPLHQPDHPLQVPPEQDSESNILVVLNDHCLQEIFNHLELRDLTNAAEVCVRFNEHAKLQFISQHQHLDFYREFIYCQLNLVDTAMKHFGKDIKSLRIESTFFKTEADVIHMIAYNCGPKLKRLTLKFFHFQNDWSAAHSIFAGIEQLELKHCHAGIGFGQLMAACVELKSLTLSDCDENNLHILQQTCPKLQELSLDCTVDNDEAFEQFIIHHPTLTKLTIRHSQISRALRIIGQNAKNLQELIYKFMFFRVEADHLENDVVFIGQLRSLKKLEINLFSHRIVPVLKILIAGKAPIEILDISSFKWQPVDDDDDDVIQYISQLKQIKCLRLHMNIQVWDRSFTDADIIEWAEKLPELDELHLGTNKCGYKFELSSIGLRKMLMHSPKLKLLKLYSIDSIKIDVDDYKAMLGTVQQRKEKVALLIKIHRGGGYRSQVDVPADVLAENRKTINIQESHF